MSAANVARGEVALAQHVLRPSFAALVRAEQELGPLFALIERAGEGKLTLAETVGLLWHCRDTAQCRLARDAFSEQLIELGLAAITPALRHILGQILKGR